MTIDQKKLQIKSAELFSANNGIAEMCIDSFGLFQEKENKQKKWKYMEKYNKYKKYEQINNLRI